VLPATPLLLSVMVRVPATVPAAVGVKVSLIVQEPLAATLPAQVFVAAKLALGVMLVMVSAALPVLLSVTACDALIVPTFWLPNGRLDGETPATGAEVATVRLKVPVTELTPLPLAVMVIVWLVTDGAVLAAWSEMLPELVVPGWVNVAVTPVGKVLVESVTLPV
jgi:hypothetical protein